MPDARQRGQLRPSISPALYDLLAAADAAETHNATKAKRQAPPLAEGDLFTSLSQGASRFAPAACEGDAAG